MPASRPASPGVLVERRKTIAGDVVLEREVVEHIWVNVKTSSALSFINGFLAEKSSDDRARSRPWGTFPHA
jgi:hypothetical protein